MRTANGGAITVSPLSVNQRGVWIAQQIEPDASCHHGGWAVRMLSGFDRHAFGRAWQAFTDRHPMARATFRDLPEGPVQEIHRELVSDFALCDASGWSDEQLDARVADALAEPFDLSRGAMRARVFTRSPNDHVMLVVLHHIAFDFASLEVMVAELPAFYAAFRAGKPPPDLPALPVDYLDFVEWQSRYLASDTGRQALAFWIDALRDAPTTLALPIDRARRPVRRAVGSALTVTLEARVVNKLRTLNKSLFRTLLTAFEATVHRFTGQSDVLTGTAASVRPSAEYAGVVGNFVNMMPLRIHLEENPTARDLLARVDRHLDEATARRQVPLPALIDELRPKRDPSTTPLFQISMGVLRARRSAAAAPNYLNLANAADAFPGERSVLYPLRQHLAQLDLELVCVDAGEDLAAEFKFNADVFERTTIERIANGFVLLSEALANDPSTRLGALPIMSEQDRQRMLVEWNASTAAYPRDRTLHGLFSDAARRAPEALALVDNRQQLTYRETEQRVRSLARRLRERGVGANSIVACCVPRSATGILAMLGILEAGGAYLPLDAGLPLARMAAVLADAGVRWAVVGQGQASLTCFDGIEILVAEDSLEVDTGEPLPPAASAHDLAYVIYTSGSTGVPKGVLVEHRSVVNTVTWMQRAFEIGPGVNTAQSIAFGFDGSVAQIWPALTGGATLHVLGDDEPSSPADVVDWLRRSGIHVAGLPTPLAELCIAQSLATPLPELRVMFMGGDRFHRPKAMPSFSLFNLYGPTEATVNTTFARIEDGDSDDVVPIGKPIANVRVYLLDDYLNPVPVGVRGEIFIGGDCLARGYLGRPELEQGRFVTDPFSVTAGSRLYRTGDLARYRANGDLEFLGRADQQLKIRGFRIELGEIEATLGRYPDVEQAVVIPHRGPSGRTSLVAYATSTSPLDAPAVRQYLADRLPEYMVPSAFVFLGELPVTSNGKIDHARLPEPVVLSGRERELPANPTEERLLEIWRGVLGNVTLGVTDDFFDAGGDSLLAMRLLPAIEEAFERRLTMVDVLRHTTVRAQSRCLLEARVPDLAARPGEPSILVLAEGGEPPFLLVHAVGGGVVQYRALANELGREHAVWAIASPQRAAGSSLERIAAVYADALCARRPTGAFRIGGWSMGGVLAMAIAHDLQRRERVVDIVVLIDAPFPQATSHEDRELFERFLADVFGPHPVSLDGAADVGQMVERAATELVLRGVLARSAAVRDVREAFELFRTHAAAMNHYAPPSWDGPVAYIRSSGEARSREEAVVKWRAVAPQLDVSEAAGDHFTMLDQKHVGAMRVILKNVLRDERAR